MKITSKKAEFGCIQTETCTHHSVMVSAGVLRERDALLLKHGVLLDLEHKCAAAVQAYLEMLQHIQRNVYV